jgi:threonine aldolase
VNRPIDLRSDFLTRPTPAMQAAMATAAAAPAHFGLREDPRQQALERRVATLLGMEDALLFPTCTMANEVALMLLTSPGDLVLAPARPHVVTSEAGAPAALAGVAVVELPDQGPCPPASAWREAARAPHDELKPRIAALVLENTHNRSGGIPIDAADARAVVAVARAHGLRAHLDGSRLFNAAVACRVAPAALCEGFDTVAISLNKGLGAPLGAMLAGSAALMARAIVLRQRLGGGMRPTGIVSAAALVALEDWTHLAIDHDRARALAMGLADVRGIRVDVEAVRTNIVVAEVAEGGDAAQACARLASHGVLALPFGTSRIRLVTYRDIDDDDVARAVAAFHAAFA